MLVSVCGCGAEGTLNQLRTIARPFVPGNADVARQTEVSRESSREVGKAGASISGAG